MPVANLATNAAPRKYGALRNPHPIDDRVFGHTPATGKPAEPDFPGRMNREAQLQFTVWRSSGIMPTHPQALVKVREFQAYYATPAYIAWKIADDSSRRAQLRNYEVDVQEASAATIPLSATADGSGGGTPASSEPAPTDNLV